MLILCWHWNSFPVHTENFYTIFGLGSWIFIHLIFRRLFFLWPIFCHRYHRHRWNPTPHTHTTHWMFWHFVFVTFMLILIVHKPNQVNIFYFSSFSSLFLFSTLARNARIYALCVRSCVRKSVARKRAFIHKMYCIHINLITGNDFHLQIKSDIEYHCWMKCFLDCYYFRENFLIIRRMMPFPFCITNKATKS